jgi:hypothetical protein
MTKQKWIDEIDFDIAKVRDENIQEILVQRQWNELTHSEALEKIKASSSNQMLLIFTILHKINLI